MILPIAMPGITVVAITTFIGAYAQQFIYRADLQLQDANTCRCRSGSSPISVRQEVIWNELMAASFVGIAPAIVVIFFLQRYLVSGLTAGAVKQ